MDYEGFLELIKKRRSIRKFRPDPIPDEYVDKIIEAARWAPSGGNSQPWEFIVVKKQELRNEIIELIKEGYGSLEAKMEATREPELRFHFAPPGFVRAPVFIILCGNPRTREAYPVSAQARGDSIFNSSLANAFLYMQLAVTSLGLGAQWVSAIAVPYVQYTSKKLLGIPVEMEFYDMLAVGYPDMEPGPRLVRAREEMVHYDYYNKDLFRTEEKVKEFIATLRRGPAI